MCKVLLVATLALCVVVHIAYAQTGDDSNPAKDPLAEACRKKLNSCLDQTESRVPGVQRREWIFLESLWRVAFDMDHCCDEYKKCMYRIGRNRQ